MRFFIKNQKYKIFFFLFYLNIGYGLSSSESGLLFKKSSTEKEQYLFYNIIEDSIVLHEINKNQQYNKIWEYIFLPEKDFIPTNIMLGDISGNGIEELIVVGYLFGKSTEIYIFKTDNLIPVAEPSIYNISSFKKGSRPEQARFMMWDEDKDSEIVIAISSPERKIIVLDYNINKLNSIADNVAKNFITETYGPINIDVFDINKDKKKELIVYTKNENASRGIYYNENKIDIKQYNSLQVEQIRFLKNENDTQEIAITKKGEIFSEKENKIISQSKENKDILGFKNGIVIGVAAKKISLLDSENNFKTKKERPFSEAVNLDQPTGYLYNLQENIMLFYNKTLTSLALVDINDNLEIKKLKKQSKAKQQPIVDNKETTIVKQQQNSASKITKKENVNTQIIYVNVQDTLVIPIEEKNIEKIKSIETNILPQGMSLDTKKLSFLWTPNTNDIGEHSFSYTTLIENNTSLQINQKDSLKVAIQKITEIDEKIQAYTIIVNDIPVLEFDNPIDTVSYLGSFYTGYNIIDKIKKEGYNLEVLSPRENTVLITEEGIYWEPKKQDVGVNKFNIQLSDGIAKTTGIITVVIDSLKNTVSDKQIATLNKEFTYQLPFQENYSYRVLDAPVNLRISNRGKIHWIPIATQLDNNVVLIEVNKGTDVEKYQIEVYVNAPPVISYRPAYEEHVTQGDTFKFKCQNFDLNLNPTLEWSIRTDIEKASKYFSLSNNGDIAIITDSLLDNHNYFITLSDGYSSDTFDGKIYINTMPQIVSTPPDYLTLGDTLKYQIEVRDSNKEKPFIIGKSNNSINDINFILNEYPKGALIDSIGLLSWVPDSLQLGSHNFEVLVNDSITNINQTFSVFVNDKPSITSVDSLSIMVGDTLRHFFNVADLNNESDLIYSITTSIDELLFNGKEGKLTWVPKKEDIGINTLEISVSDGFSSSKDTQKLQIFVYIPPTLTSVPDSIAYVNMEYKYSPKAFDMYKDTVFNKDIFIEFINQDSLFSGKYNNATNKMEWIPSLKEAGMRRLEFIIKDKYNTINRRFYDINVLVSPCETSDTLYINNPDTIYINNNNSKFETRPRSPFSPF